MSLKELAKQITELGKWEQLYEMLHDDIYVIGSSAVHDDDEEITERAVGSFLLRSMKQYMSEIIEEHEHLHGDNPTHQEMVAELEKDYRESR